MNTIPTQKLTDLRQSKQNSINDLVILPSAIDGMRTLLHTLQPNETRTFAAKEKLASAFLFTRGTGDIRSEQELYAVHEISFFAPQHGAPFTVTAGPASVIEILELEIVFDENDMEELQSYADKYPYFVSYSDCSTYSEKIKSPKTVSRTLMPEHTFPRLCVGSVETTGDDHVAAHKHPMLEQLFFGLEANETIVHADELSTAFGEDELLYRM